MKAHFVKYIGIVCSLMLGLTSTWAAATLRLSADGGATWTVVVDNGPGDLSGTTGRISFDDFVGTAFLNATFGLTKPAFGSAGSPSMEMLVNNTAYLGGGTLIAQFSDTDFSPSGGTQTYQVTAGGNATGTILLKTWRDNGDVLFGSTESFPFDFGVSPSPTAIVLTSQGPFTGSAYTGSGSGSASGSTPYSLTMEVVITDDLGGLSVIDALLQGPSCDCAPSIVCPEPVTVNCGGDTSTNALPMPVISAGPSCDPVVTTNDVITPGNCPGNYVINRTWTVTPICGEAKSCTQIITVQDNTPPIISAAGANATIDCPATPVFTPPTATDTCDSAPQIVLVSDETAPGTCAGAYTRTKTWKAVDACGNASGTVSQTITVRDNTPPVVSCAADKTVECGIAWNFDAPTASDTCSSATISIVSTVTNGTACTLTATRTWEAKDACGNTAQCSQTVTVRDTTPPVITCLPNTFVTNCQPLLFCSYTPGGWGAPPNGNNPGMILAANFSTVYPSGVEIGIPGPAGFSAKFTSASAIELFLPNGGTPSTLTSDSVNPTSTSAAEFGSQVLALKLNVDFSAAGLTGGTNGPLGNLILNDPSSPLNGKSINEILAIANTVLGGGTVSGVTVSSLMPLIDSLNQGFDNCQPNGWAITHFTITACAIATNTPTAPIVSDNCDLHPLITFKDSSVSGSCGATIIRTWYATDACGNSNSCIQQIGVQDTIPPMIRCSADKMVECGQTWSFDAPTATDNSGLTPTITIVSTTTNGTACALTATRTWNAVDACGNPAQCSQTVTVRDTTPPVITCPIDGSMSNLQFFCSYTQGGWGAPPNGGNPGSILASNFMKVYPGGFVEIGIPGKGSKYSIKLTSALAVQNYLPDGGTPSVLAGDFVNPTTTPAGVFGAQVLALRLNVNFSDAQITGIPNAALGDLVFNNPASPLNGKTVRQIEAIAEQALAGVNTSGLSISGLNSLVDSFNQAFDNCEPNGFAKQYLLPPGQSTSTGIATAIDNCDPNPLISSNEVITAGACPGSFVITRTWTATDVCGNSSSCVQVIRVGCPPLTLDCAGASGQVGVPYNSALVASGGTSPYTFSIMTGVLPPGLTLNPTTGAITGTPTAAGTYPYTAKVVDSTSGTALTTTVNCSITVIPAPLTLLCAGASGQVGVPYNSALVASGGTSPYTFSITIGVLPPGLTLNPTTGAITGTPTTAGTYPYTAKVVDSTSGTALSTTANCSITISPASQGCTLTIGYYKNHPTAITPLPIYLGTSGGTKTLIVSSQAIGVNVLGQHYYGAPANGITKLYAQLLAAKLNILHGGSGSAVTTVISSADAFLATHNYLDWSALSVTDQNSVLAWHSALDNFNNGVSGPGHCGSTETARALAPAATTASAQVKLNWKASREATSYNVTRSLTPNGPYTVVKSGLTTTNYTDSTVVNGTVYYYVICALKSGVETTDSDEVSAIPTAALPSPWKTADIGGVVAAGGANYVSGKFTVVGSGNDIGGTADEFRCVYQAASGDCSIIARVVSVGNTAAGAKAGIMIRETLTAGSRHAGTFITPGTGAAARARTTTGGSTVSTGAAGPVAPYWLKGVRKGSTFTAYYSSNGTTWTVLATQSISMSSSAYIGLAVTSQNDGVLCTATFDSVTATP